MIISDYLGLKKIDGIKSKYHEPSRFKCVRYIKRRMASVGNIKWYDRKLVTEFSYKSHCNMRMKSGDTYYGTIANGERNGYGLYRSEPLMYGVVRSSGKELVHWTEYYGEWLHDKPHGRGVLRNVSGDGEIRVIFEGAWLKGVPESSAFFGL